MIFLSPLLLSLSSNLDTLTICLSYGIKKIHLTKSITLLLAIITSIGTFISMYIGKLILTLLPLEMGNIFGSILLTLTGIYFIIEYIRLEKKHAGYDTSYYFESSLKYKNIIENPNIIDSDKSNYIDIRECLNLSLALIFNNMCASFAASITGVNISISIFFTFIIIIVSVCLGYFNSDIYISKWFSKYSNLICGVVLITLGLYETFV